MDDKAFSQCLKKVKLPEIKMDVYKRMGFQEVKGEKTTKTALKAYLMLMADDDAFNMKIQ